MTHVDRVEALWLAIVVTALTLTLFGLWDAWQVRIIVNARNGKTREVLAGAAVRREVFHVIGLVCALLAVVPGLFEDYPTSFSLPVVALMLLPISLGASSAFDIRDRRRALRLLATTPVVLTGYATIDPSDGGRLDR